MNQELLQRFLNEEATTHVRQLLLRHISDCRAGASQGQRTFEFNQFNVTIDCESSTAIIEDELNVSPSGETSLSLEQFAADLWR